MGNQLTKSQKFGIQWRWLFLVGGLIYAFNILKVLFKPQEIYSFLGLSMNRWLFLVIQLVISAWLLATFTKNHRLFREETLRQLMENEENHNENDIENE